MTAEIILFSFWRPEVWNQASFWRLQRRILSWLQLPGAPGIYWHGHHLSSLCFCLHTATPVYLCSFSSLMRTLVIGMRTRLNRGWSCPQILHLITSVKILFQIRSHSRSRWMCLQGSTTQPTAWVYEDCGDQGSGICFFPFPLRIKQCGYGLW